MKPLYLFVSRFATAVVPILLILISLALNLTNSQSHKNTLKSSNFYTKLSNEIQTTQNSEEQIKRGFGALVLNIALKDLATPGWIQNLTERNIESFSEWMEGNQDQWILYVPSKEIEVAVSENLDQQAKELVENYSDQIPACSSTQEQNIKREGFNLELELCLPQSVKNGSQTLSQFMELSSQDAQNSEYLEKLIKNNQLNPFNDNLSVTSLNPNNPIRSGFYTASNTFRSTYQTLKQFIWVMLVIILALMISSTVLAKYADRNPLKEFKRLLWQSATGTFVLIAILVLTFGGTAYLTSGLQKVLLPGISSNQLIPLISFEIVKLTFNVFSVSFWSAFGLISVFMLISVLQHSGVLSNYNQKNKKLKNNFRNHEQNPTFDGQFQNILLNEGTLKPSPAIPSNSVNVQTLKLSPQIGAETDFQTVGNPQVNNLEPPKISQELNNSKPKPFGSNSDTTI